LEKGTAVLVDAKGIARVRCACGNPLTPMAQLKVPTVYRGAPWPDFRPQRVGVTQRVDQARPPVNNRRPDPPPWQDMPAQPAQPPAPDNHGRPDERPGPDKSNHPDDSPRPDKPGPDASPPSHPDSPQQRPDQPHQLDKSPAPDPPKHLDKPGAPNKMDRPASSHTGAPPADRSGEPKAGDDSLQASAEPGKSVHPSPRAHQGGDPAGRGPVPHARPDRPDKPDHPAPSGTPGDQEKLRTQRAALASQA
jgi:hypothetical protein